MRPAAGVPASPPELDPEYIKNSIFNEAAPTLDEVDHLEQKHASILIPSVNPEELERRITLIARMVIEDALWKKGTMSVKEKADLALNAIRTFEGSKSKLWVEDPNERNIPKNREAMEAEKKRIERRVQELYKQKLSASKQDAEDALEVAK